MGKIVRGRKKAVAISLALIIALVVPQAAFAGGVEAATDGTQAPAANEQSVADAALDTNSGVANEETALENAGGGGAVII
jgi:hypothetical protein